MTVQPDLKRAFAFTCLLELARAGAQTSPMSDPVCSARQPAHPSARRPGKLIALLISTRFGVVRTFRVSACACLHQIELIVWARGRHPARFVIRRNVVGTHRIAIASLG